MTDATDLTPSEVHEFAASSDPDLLASRKGAVNSAAQRPPPKA